MVPSMAKLPPPPVVGRGNRPADVLADDAEHAAAQADLPSSVTELPEAWLIDADVVAVPPAPPGVETAAAVSADVGACIDASELVEEMPSPAPVVSEPVPPTTGAALIAVLIARCGDHTPSTTSTRAKDGVAGLRFDGGPVAPAAASPDDRGAISAAATGAAAQHGDAGSAGQPSGNDDAKPATAQAGEANGRPADPPTTDAAPADAAAAPAAAQAAPAETGADDAEPTLEAAAAPNADTATPANTAKAAVRPGERKSRTDAASTSGTASAEGPMTAAESLEKARAAWKAGNAKDTYKYANKSRFKEPSPEATELATLAACKMKLDDAAKSSFKQLSGDRKKRTRTACRDFGVRVGL
jgi:hypothetical protein